MTTRYYSTDIFRQHLTPAGHPERPDRLKVVNEALAHADFKALNRNEAPAADSSHYALAHPQAFVSALENAVPPEGIFRIDADTTMSPKSWECVSHAVGAATDAIDAVFSGEASNAFIAARPPGHHAEKTTAMGFCLINTIAVAARYAQQFHGVERVAIVDFDVHHGNGTQDIFFDDPSVLYGSTHEMPLFPGSGAKGETGVGNIINAPLSAHMIGEDVRDAFTTRILPALEKFRPDLLLVSAGFDAHYRDPLANINLKAEDFDWITGKLMDIAGRHCNNRLISLLEGGYDLEGLAESSAAHVKRLMNG